MFLRILDLLGESWRYHGEHGKYAIRNTPTFVMLNIGGLAFAGGWRDFFSFKRLERTICLDKKLWTKSKFEVRFLTAVCVLVTLFLFVAGTCAVRCRVRVLTTNHSMQIFENHMRKQPQIEGLGRSRWYLVT